MAPKVSVFLPSYNKGEYVLDAMRSVFAQTMTDWELWILENSNDGKTNKIVEQWLGIENDNDIREWASRPVQRVHYERLEGEETEKQRREKYMTAWLLNAYYPRANGEYVFYISDDDLIDPECFEVMAQELDSNPGYQVVYAGLRMTVVTRPGQTGPFPSTGIPALDARTFPGTVDQRVDGGQVMHRKSCLDHLVPPYFEESPDPQVSKHADGIFLERLVGRFPFQPVSRYLITHRYTPQSLWARAENAAAQD